MGSEQVDRLSAGQRMGMEQSKEPSGGERCGRAALGRLCPQHLRMLHPAITPFWPWKLHKERALSLANGRWVWGWQTWCLLWAECATWRSVAQGREIKVERLFAAILKRVLGASLRILKLSFMQRR